MAQTNKVAVVRSFIEEVWNKGNLGVVDDLVADAYVRHEPLLGERRGKASLEELVRQLRTAFPDLHVSVDELGTFGDRIFVRWTGRGTHRGPMLGVPASNRRGEVKGITLTRVVDGKIIEDHQVYDTRALALLIG